jgi:hypothetical protein
VCVECTSDATCSDGNPVCDVTNELCVECNADADCKDPGKPGCLVATHRCEDCSKDVKCPGNKVCDLTQGKCN